jgi:hypothetical protein
MSISVSAVTVMIEKVTVLIDRAMIPVWPPPPTTPIKAPEKASNINARAESKSKTEIRVIPSGIITVEGRSPDIRRIVVRYVDHLGVGWLNLNHRSVPLPLGCDGFLYVGLQFASRHGLGPHPLHGIHYIGLL